MAKGGGSLGNQFKAAVALLVIASFLFAWVEGAHIRNLDDARHYFQAWSRYIDRCTQDKVQWNCSQPPFDGNTSVDDPLGGSSSEANSGTNAPEGGHGSSSGSGSKSSSGGGNSPQGAQNSTSNTSSGRNTGGSPLAQVAALSKTLGSLKLSAPAKVAYDRSQWKHWVGTPCDARKQVLIRDGKNVKVQQTSTTCKILSGSWSTVYDNPPKTVNDPSQLDIDHTVPLGYAASHGGQEWTPALKEQFANDLSHLKAVSASENRAKGDKGPGEYMPPNKSDWCDYSTIWVNTLSKYHLTLTAGDRSALQGGLALCKA